MTARILATDSVFINCPFDEGYWPMLEAMVFGVVACGFMPRSALEEADNGDNRLDKITRLIRNSAYGIHDLSRTEVNPPHGIAPDALPPLPRFNMPFELGLDIAWKRHSDVPSHKNKKLLIFEAHRFTTQKCLSDIAGQDVTAHGNDPATVLARVCEWLRVNTRRNTVPGPLQVANAFKEFAEDLPKLCEDSGLDRTRLPFREYVAFARSWMAT